MRYEVLDAFPLRTKSDLQVIEILNRAKEGFHKDALAIKTVSGGYVLNGWGVFTDQSGKVCVDELRRSGWSRDHIDGIGRGLGFERVGDDWHAPRVILDRAVIIPGDAVMVTFPGGYTYGHWLLEISARLQILLDKHLLSNMKFLVPGPIASWMAIVLETFGIKSDACVPLATDTVVNVQGTLMIPGLGNTSGFLPDYPFRASIGRLRAIAALCEQPVEPMGDYLFVRHTPQTSSNHRGTLSNASELFGVAEPRGFQFYDPLKFPLATQAYHFSQAKIIIGEDSSALHNIIWSRQAHLVVLGSEKRRNTLHGALAYVTDQAVTYLEADEVDAGGFQIDPQHLADALAQI